MKSGYELPPTSFSSADFSHDPPFSCASLWPQSIALGVSLFKINPRPRLRAGLRFLQGLALRIPTLACISPLCVLVPSLGSEATHSSVFAGRSQGQRRLEGYNPWGRKESDMTACKQQQWPGSVNTLEKHVKPNNLPLRCISLRTSSSLSSSLLSALKDSSVLFCPITFSALCPPASLSTSRLQEALLGPPTAQSRRSFFHLPQLHHLLICQWNTVLLTFCGQIVSDSPNFFSFFFFFGLFLGFFFLYLSSHQWSLTGG